jgi:chromatin remodeling complex protein RSC6
MPRKSTKTVSPNEEKKVVESEVEAQAEVAPASKTGQLKSKAKAVSKENVAKASNKGKTKTTKIETISENPSEEVDAPKKNVQRHVPTNESVEKEFDELVASIDEEITKLRESTGKSKGVKFLRTVNKKLKTLKNHAFRVSKKKPTTRRNNTNSGFLKPVQISKDLAKFTGWDQGTARSRVDVTKYICNYIKEKNLQDPTDKRNIRVEEDSDLKKLLKFDGKDKKPLTYYRLQTYLKPHFTPATTPEVVTGKKA